MKHRNDKDVMALYYKKEGSRLYGYIEFYRRPQNPTQKVVKAFRKSKPFVIGQYSPNGYLEILGSVDFMLKTIRRLIDKFIKTNNAWYSQCSRARTDIELHDADSQYNQDAMDAVVLMSTYARNLFDLFKRFDTKTIPRLDYNNSTDGSVTLRELFDTIIHNRYYYFDGNHVRDLFSDDFKKKQSALSQHFMGYGFDVFDFIREIASVMEDITIKDLTQLLRWKVKFLKSNSKPQDIVFLIQNLHAFSELLKRKIPTREYDFMRIIMLEGMDIPQDSKMKLSDGTVVEAAKFFHNEPHIGINRDLSKKAFDISVRCSVVNVQETKMLKKEDLSEHKVTIGFNEFFQKANEAFGKEHLLAPKTRLEIIPFKSPSEWLNSRHE